MRSDRIKVLLLISIALTILSATLTYFATAESKKRVDLVLHSYEVLRQSSDMLSSMSQVESSVRGYMLTWDSSFLKNYAAEKEGYKYQLATFRKLVEDNPHQVNLIDERIEPYIIYKLEQLGIVATIAQHYSIDSAVSYSYTHRSRLAIENLQSHVAEFNKHENSLLEERLGNLNDILRLQRLIRYVSLGLIALTLLVAYSTITENQKKNTELIAQLNQTNSTLEVRVKERTQELDRQNNSITELNSQLQQSMEEIQSFYETLNLRNQKAEDALNEISDLYNNAPCGYHSLDSSGMFVRINDTELKWLGYTRDEVVGKLSFEKILTDESKTLFQKIYSEFKKKGSVSNIEFELKRKDETSFPIILSSTAVYNSSGEYERGRTTIFDISARKDLENKLIKANDALIHLNDEKDHFLGIAAHDLKSPLNSILGLLNLLRNEHGLSPVQQEYLLFIEQSCISMKRLVNNLLDINRIEQGGLALNKRRILISDLLKEQERSFKETATKKTINLTIKDLTNGTYILADEDVLTRILENLISNALKFSPIHKEVIVQASHTNTHIRFEVKDQGPGIRKDEQHKLFGKFQKLSARPTGGESSSGLGLSIVKELVVLMEGTITVETIEGKGTTFITEIPLQT